MKTQLRKLRLLSRFINMDLFYSVRVETTCIYLQGKFSNFDSKKVSRLFNLEFDNDQGMVIGERNRIRIILT